MSRATLRAAMVATYGHGAIAGLTDVYPAQKKTTGGDEWYANVGDHSGALGYVFIERDVEARRSLAGASAGYKKISYDVSLVVQYRHNGNDPSDTEDAGQQAVDEFDALIEAIKVKIRSDRTLGGAVFQIGEGDTIHGDDIEVLSDLPTVVDGYIYIWTAVRLKVIEFTSP